MAAFFSLQNMGYDVVNAELCEDVKHLSDEYQAKAESDPINVSKKKEAQSLNKFYANLDKDRIFRNKGSPDFKIFRDADCRIGVKRGIVKFFNQTAGLPNSRCALNHGSCFYAYVAEHWDVYRYLFKQLSVMRHGRTTVYNVYFYFSQEDIDNCQPLQGKFLPGVIYTLVLELTRNKCTTTLITPQQTSIEPEKAPTDSAPELLRVGNLLNRHE